jgi:hypothetical protein
MPSTSKKQHNFMAAVANNPTFAKKAGVPQSVGSDFVQADKGKKFGGGARTRADLQKINRPKTEQGKNELFAKGGDMKESKAMMKKEVSFMKKAGAPKSMLKHEMAEAKMAKGGVTRADGVASKGKTKGKMVVMKKGGKC